MTHENTPYGCAMSKPFCSTCGKDVAEILCPVCAKWWHDNDPLHTQALAAGYASVGEWVAAKDAEIVRLKQPHWFYDTNDSDRCFYSPHEVIDWIDPDAGDHLIEVTTARPCPSIWCAVRVTDDPDAGERFIFTEHATEAEARAALGDPQ